ncbi:heme ABC transporter permease [Plesiomonas shigelloides]|uniref:heme ABC transporter permease n=1 Tax=Plesiomonas shigelloides TaxID=703 RepID=UPI00057A8D0B|nr:heme ABC transporter permease [Plesiomonas shigelloides]
MWKWLHQYAAPERLYQLCGRLLPFSGVLAVVLLVTGLVWGFVFAPADYQQGDSYRIMYLHVPAAIWSMGIYASMAIAAFIGLVWQIKMSDLASAAMAPVGAVFTFIALATGSAWGKPMWGAWWVWDARLTSELILLFLYLGAIALYNAFDDRRLAGRAASILILVGVVNLPIIHFSVEWWNTLHQGSTNMQQSIAPSMRTPLRLSILGFLFFFITLTMMRLRNLILAQERHRPWVKNLALCGAATPSSAVSGKGNKA